jgi:hypothetical protein
MCFDEYSPAHRVAFWKYMAAGCTLRGIDDRYLSALAEDPNFRAEVDAERQRRAVLPESFCIPAGHGPCAVLSAHVQHLAKAAPAIRVLYVPVESRAKRLVGDGQANLTDREIYVPPLDGLEAYLVALHELGHQRTVESVVPDRLAQEVAAWHWAYTHALVWNFRAELEMNKCLVTYLDSEKYATHPHRILAAEEFLRTLRPAKAHAAIGDLR